MSSKQKTRLGAESFSDLISRAKKGDQGAFTALYEATSQEVYATVRSMVRTEELALDIQQDSYVFAFTHLDQLCDPAKFRAWLRTIAVNRTRSVLRRQTPVLFSELDLEHDPLPELPDLSTEASPELSLDRKETTRLIREILDELTDGQRMLVGLYYYERMPVGKIAQTLEVTPGTVKKQLSRARKKIEASVKRLEEKGVKLYGLSPLPFLLALLRQQEPAAEAGKAVLAKTVEKAGLAAGAKAAAPVAEAVAVHVGRPFFETALGKLILGVISVSVIGSSVLGYNWVKNHFYGDIRPPKTVAADEDFTTEPIDTTPTQSDTTGELNAETEELVETGDLIPDSETTMLSPEPCVPIGPGSAPAEPDDPAVTTDVTDFSDAEPEFLRWYWLNHESEADMDLMDCLDPSNGYVLTVETLGSIIPHVMINTPGVVTLEYLGKEDSYDGIGRYEWYVTYVDSGTTQLICEFNGEERILTITNPDYSAAFLHSEWSFWQNDMGPDNRVSEKLIGNSDDLWVYEQHGVSEQPTILVYTDAPQVLQIDYLNSGPDMKWYQNYTRWHVTVVGCGTANLYVEYNGEIVKTYTIPVQDGPNSVLKFEWVYENEANTYGVGGVNYIDMLVEGNETPRVYSDCPDVARLSISAYSSGQTVGRIQGYTIKVSMLAVGTARIICEYQGEIIYDFSVTVD